MKEAPQPPVDPEKAVREAAIDRVIRGEKPTAICEKWQFDKERWTGKTIRATIDTQQQKLFVYYQPKGGANCQLIAQFDYPLGKDIQYGRRLHKAIVNRQSRRPSNIN
jgi:hypothetical protein